MFSREDFIKMKEQNEQTIQANDAVICEKQKANVDLEAENRVLSKLIALEQSNTQTELDSVQENSIE